MVATLVVLGTCAPFAADIFNETEPFDISDPDSEVERAYAAYEMARGFSSEPDVLLLFEPGGSFADGTPERQGPDIANQLDAVDGIGRVPRPEGRAGLISSDGDAILIVGQLDAGANRVEVGARVEQAFADDPDVVAGGVAVAAHQIGEQTDSDTRRIELYAAPFLLLILLAAFRSIVAAIIPLVLSACSILVAFAALRLLSGSLDIDVFSLQVVTGLGVGLAIDYSLFMIARFRAEIRECDSYQEAHARTLATAGRTVAFSALTVAAALAALILFPQQFLRSTGVAGALVALLSGAISVLVLPAILALLGPRVDPAFAGAEDESEVPPDPLGNGSSYWRQIATRVQARPLPVAAIGLVLMLLIGLPGTGGRLTTPGPDSLPEGESSRSVANALNSRFTQLPRTELTVVTSDDPEVGNVAGELEERTEVGLVAEPRRLNRDGVAVRIAAQPDPLSEEGQQLVKDVRAAPWPEGTLVGGRAAELADQRESISSYAVGVVAIVVVTNLLLVLLTVRSLVLPLVAILLNALTVFAAYGLMVALFENSTTAELLGTKAQLGVDISVPILAFAVVFGLSTDYGIFLFSRVAEGRKDGLPPAEAVSEGLAQTGRLISSAAVIFSVAVGAFAFSDLVIVKEFSVAVAIAVVLDATIVRGLLVPASLALLGERAWVWPGRSSER